MIDATIRERISMTSVENLRLVMDGCAKGEFQFHNCFELASACFEELARRGVATFGDLDLVQRSQAA